MREKVLAAMWTGDDDGERRIGADASRSVES
jgi:hypothetical protein